MKIRMPSTRACYPASRNEPGRLLCWIPRRELEQLAAEGRVKPETLEDYPSGLEVRLSRPGFAEVGLDLGVDPDALHAAYQALRGAGALPASGIVAGAHLEAAATGGFPPQLRALPEPEWTAGEDARSVMGRL
jgi:hypothetical protein